MEKPGAGSLKPGKSSIAQRRLARPLVKFCTVFFLVFVSLFFSILANITSETFFLVSQRYLVTFSLLYLFEVPIALPFEQEPPWAVVAGDWQLANVTSLDALRGKLVL